MLTFALTVSPKWLIPPPNHVLEVIQGQDVTIDCQASGYPAPRIWWESQITPPSPSRSAAAHTNTPSYQPIISNSHIHALENGSLIIKGISRKSDSPAYLCHATNGVGSGISQVVKILIHGTRIACAFT